MSNENQNGFMDVFFNKLKEQSFQIVLLLQNYHHLKRKYKAYEIQ